MKFWAEDGARPRKKYGWLRWIFGAPAPDATLGGYLVDNDKPWAMRDKVQHTILGYALRLIIDVLPLDPLPKYLVHLTCQVTWELLEVVLRMDGFSWRDLIANHLGYAIAEAQLAVQA